MTKYYGLQKIGALGKAGAHKVMLMAAIAFNLKKYFKKVGRALFHAFFTTTIDTLQLHLLAFHFQSNQCRFANG